MLNKIRKASDNVIFKIVMLLIVLSFSIWGIKDMLGGFGNFTIVSFKNADPIKNDEFSRVRKNELMKIQQTNNIVLSEDEIQQYGIDKMVVNNMVTQRLINLLASKYDIDFSNEVLSSMIQSLPGFQNKNGEFDFDIFKSYLAHSNMNEKEFSDDIKLKFSQNILLNEFVSSYYTPKIIVDNIISFLSEERVIDIVSINLVNDQYVKIDSPKKEQLEEFYKSNQELFQTLEKRNIKYIIITPENVKKLSSVTEEEAKQFLNDNKGEISNIDKAKQILLAQKQENLLNELVKNLEDEIAAGSSIEEISEKFNLKTNEIKEITADKFVERNDIGVLVETAFSLQAEELSYPTSIKDSKDTAILYISKITPSVVPEFKEIESLVTKEWKTNEYKKLNMKIMEDFISIAKPESFASESLERHLNLQTNVKLRRTELTQNMKFPPDMILGIFKSKVGNISGIYDDGEKAFAIIVRQISNNPETRKNIEKNAGDNIRNKLKEGVIEELLFYMKKQEKPSINKIFEPSPMDE